MPILSTAVVCWRRWEIISIYSSIPTYIILVLVVKVVPAIAAPTVPWAYIKAFISTFYIVEPTLFSVIMPAKVSLLAFESGSLDTLGQ